MFYPKKSSLLKLHIVGMQLDILDESCAQIIILGQKYHLNYTISVTLDYICIQPVLLRACSCSDVVRFACSYMSLVRTLQRSVFPRFFPRLQLYNVKTASPRLFSSGQSFKFEMETVNTTERLSKLRDLMKQHRIDVYSRWLKESRSQHFLTLFHSRSVRR